MLLRLQGFGGGRALQVEHDLAVPFCALPCAAAHRLESESTGFEPGSDELPQALITSGTHPQHQIGKERSVEANDSS